MRHADLYTPALTQALSRKPLFIGSACWSASSFPGANRHVHMIRAGREIVLVGVAEHGVAPIRSYTEEEAYEAGLIRRR